MAILLQPIFLHPQAKLGQAKLEEFTPEQPLPSPCLQPAFFTNLRGFPMRQRQEICKSARDTCSQLHTRIQGVSDLLLPSLQHANSACSTPSQQPHHVFLTSNLLQPLLDAKIAAPPMRCCHPMSPAFPLQRMLLQVGYKSQARRCTRGFFFLEEGGRANC